MFEPIVGVPESAQRGISIEFERELQEGILNPLLKHVKHDDTVSLEIRNGYVDIYYRGGRLLGLHEQAKGTRFRTQFDMRYCDGAKDYRLPAPPPPARTIASAEDSRAWVEAFAAYKQQMDVRFSAHPKIEREYQQAVVRDNNRHHTGDVSDYMVVDIEYAQSPRAFPEQKANYRYDMVGFRWPVAGGTRADRVVTPVIMEMKAGDGALQSPADPKTGEKMPGLIKHVEDMERFLTPAPGEQMSRPFRLMCTELLRMCETKRTLGLPSIPKRMKKRKIDDITPRPEVLFVIANHQPSSTILHRELLAVRDLLSSVGEPRADYYVADVSFAGYALFADNLMTIDQAIEATARKA